MAFSFSSPSSPSLLSAASRTSAAHHRCAARVSPTLHPSALPSSATSAKVLTSPPPPPLQVSGVSSGDNRNEFYLNLGMAVRTLREDLPSLFVRDLNYDIYRDDITFCDPMNTFRGIENYKLIFWALRFHGKILFREIGLDVLRVWQPSDDKILIRWNLRGVPRVPWEARGEFQGTSRYKLDRNGKIYEHKVDNLAFNFPRMSMRPATVLDMVVSAVACPTSPNLTFLGEDFLTEELSSSSWVAFYRAVRETVDREERLVVDGSDGLLVSC